MDFPPNAGNDAAKPRTAVGRPAGGHRLLLVAVDGSANFSAGLGFDDMAKLMARLGAYEAFVLDGGGSTEIVARRPGDTGAGVVNTPSDGAERPVPNGVGLFGRRGSGQLRGLDVRPRADRVIPGLTVDVAVAGYDEAWGPAATGGHQVGWTAEPGSLGKVSGGVFRAGRPGAGVLRAHAGAGGGEHGLRVLGDLDRLAFTERTVTIEPGATVAVGLAGYDADGFGAPVAPRDAALDYDRAVITVAAGPDGGFAVTGAAGAGGTSATLTATVQGVTARLPVSAGLVDVPLADFEPGEAWTALAARGTASVAVVAAADRPGAAADNHALRLGYDFTGQTSTSAAYAVAGPGPITLPAGTRKLALWVNGDGRNHWLRAMLSSQGTTNVPFTFASPCRLDRLAPGRRRPPGRLLRPGHTGAARHRGDRADQQERRAAGLRRPHRPSRAAAGPRRAAAARPVRGRAGRSAGPPLDLSRGRVTLTVAAGGLAASAQVALG